MFVSCISKRFWFLFSRIFFFVLLLLLHVFVVCVYVCMCVRVCVCACVYAVLTCQDFLEVTTAFKDAFLLWVSFASPFFGLEGTLLPPEVCARSL